jgi:tetratricopeptide (TPR) repeat protein
MMNRLQTLWGEQQYAEATLVAQQVLSRDPDNTAFAAAEWRGQLAMHYAQIEDLERSKKENFWKALYQVELSAVPNPDEQAMTYPDPKFWEEITIKRAKYKAVDLSIVSPKEEEIRRALTRPISVNFDNTPLSDVIDFLREETGVNIYLDPASVKELNIELDQPITLKVNSIQMKYALKLLLEQLQLTYLIEDDVLKIVSEDKAKSILSTKVYPVADLTVPIPDLNSGGVGLGGALGGGNQGQGGLGGGGFGGFGGGGGGGGGLGGGAVGGAGGGGGGGSQGGGDLGGALINLINDILGNDSRMAPNMPGGPAVIAKAPNGVAKAATKGPVKRRDRSKPVTGADWDALFADRTEPDTVVRGAIIKLSEAGRSDQVVLMLKALLRQEPARGWLYRPLALAMKASGEEAVEIRRTLESLIDLAPDRVDARWNVADALADLGERSAAMSILKELAERHPGSINVEDRLLRIAEMQLDTETAVQAGDRLLSRDWPRQNEAIQRRTREALDRLADRLARANRPEEAERVRAVRRSSPVRDLQVKLSWVGEADIDLVVVEPKGIVCSNGTPRTINGGVLASDGIGNSETYSAAEATSGPYDLLIKPIWGRPASGVVTVDIIKRAGTPDETRDRLTVRVDQGPVKPITVTLENGRRTKPAALSVDDTLVAGDDAAVRGNPVAELRQLIATGRVAGQGAKAVRIKAPGGAGGGQPIATGGFGGLPGGSFAQVGGGGGGGFGGGGAVAFDPVISVISDGPQLTVQAVASADRRYVRMTLIPVISAIDPISDTRVISVGGTAGGGGFGGGFGGGGGGLGGGAGAAGS